MRILDQLPGLEASEQTIVTSLLDAAREPAPILFLWTGYGKLLCDHAASLYEQKITETIHIFGYNSYPWKQNPIADAKWYRDYLIEKHGVPPASVISDAENDGLGTRSQALKSTSIVEGSKQNRAILVTAGYHLPRAYMTLVKSLHEKDMTHIKVIPVPFKIKDWASIDETIGTSWQEEFASNELPRIRSYQKTGHVASWAEIRAYLEQHKLTSPQTNT